MIRYEDTPIQEIFWEPFKKAGVRVLVKREDLNNETVSGNKWWKLKYNLEVGKNKNFGRVLTFGGAYSNHIYSTSAAAKQAGLESIGIIRGEELATAANPTLSFARQQGMILHFVSREDYRQKTNSDFLNSLEKQFGKFYLIPEGGTNSLAVKGCSEFAVEKLASMQFDKLFVPVGTGGTIAGLICGFRGEKEIVGVSVLKDGDFLKSEIKNLIIESAGECYSNWSLLTSYHHGGYAKVTNELMKFIDEMKSHNLPLDPVYTGKLMWAITQEIQIGKIERGSTVLALHTGGLQITTADIFKNSLRVT
jgi:1-aminocyclopropane-1-carboxylate deaminase